MSLDELVGELKKSNPEAAELITSYPVDIRESQPDFLGGAAYLQITVQMPYHPTFLRLVYGPGKGVYWPGSVDQLERLRTELGIAIKDADMALRYAQWRLDHTEGAAFWLVSSVEQIPFITGLPLFAKDVEKAKTAVAGKIASPTADQDRDGFAVTLSAVQHSSLVRYNARVERDATWSCSKMQLVADTAQPRRFCAARQDDHGISDPICRVRSTRRSGEKRRGDHVSCETSQLPSSDRTLPSR